MSLQKFPLKVIKRVSQQMFFLCLNCFPTKPMNDVYIRKFSSLGQEQTYLTSHAGGWKSSLLTLHNGKHIMYFLGG